MLAATTSMNGTLGADHTDAVALFAQLMSTLAGNIATTIEFIYDRVPTLPGSTFAAMVLRFHCIFIAGKSSHLLLRELRGEVLKKLQKGPDHLCIQFCAGLF